jgi:alanine dehydrogenase
VRIFDNNVYKLMRLQNQVGRQLHTSVINPIHLREQLLTADVAIGAMHSPHGRTPVVVPEDIVRRYETRIGHRGRQHRPGRLFSKPRQRHPRKPTFRQTRRDPLLRAQYSRPRGAHRLRRHQQYPHLAPAKGRIRRHYPLITSHEGLRNGVYTYKGCLTNAYLGERFQLKSTDLDLLITSDF